MEWGRSCYAGTWRLFRDSEATTAGRYYFAAADVPHFNGYTHLGSRRWHDANWPADVRLGELTGTPQPYNLGELPAILPLPRVAGSLSCINNGELLADAIPVGELIDGFPSACFEQLGEDLLFAMLSAFDRCAVQRLWAAAIEGLYDFLVDEIGELLLAFLGADVAIEFHEGNGIYPAVITGVSATFCFAIVEGTANFQQVALQAFDLILPPQNMGVFSTASLWYNASTWIHEKLMAAGQQAGTPVFLCGHSYGGCAALILAARYRAGSSSRVIRYLTYGAPKVGDERLADLIRQCEGLNLCNDDDLVTIVPPDYVTLLPVMIALGVPALAFWQDWKRQPTQTRMDSDGSLHPHDMPFLDFVTLYAMAVKALASIPQDPIAGHRITEYRARIEQRCAGVEWPIDAEVDELIKAIPPDGPPGSDCGQAYIGSIPFDETFDIDEGATHWIRLPKEVGTWYLQSIEPIVGLVTVAIGFEGTACDDLQNIYSLDLEGGAFKYFHDYGDYDYFRIISLSGPATYRLKSEVTTPP